MKLLDTVCLYFTLIIFTKDSRRQTYLPSSSYFPYNKNPVWWLELREGDGPIITQLAFRPKAGLEVSWFLILTTRPNWLSLLSPPHFKNVSIGKGNLTRKNLHSEMIPFTHSNIHICLYQILGKDLIEGQKCLTVKMPIWLTVKPIIVMVMSK